MPKQNNYWVNNAEIVLLEDFGFFNQITLMDDEGIESVTWCHDTLQRDQISHESQVKVLS